MIRSTESSDESKVYVKQYSSNVQGGNYIVSEIDNTNVGFCFVYTYER